jgi:purine-binding chemotaxis protein CheW
VEEPMSTTSRRFATFYLDRLHFGIEVEQVQEVIRYQEMTRVPLASPVVQGLINLRGQIVTAIDLRRRLKLGARAEGELPMNVVVRTEDGALSLLVDEIGDVLEITEETFEQPLETMRGVARELIRGVYKLQDSLLLVLDTERAVQIDGIESKYAS